TANHVILHAKVSSCHTLFMHETNRSSDRKVLPDGRSALWLAADRGDLQEVDRLIRTGARLNKRQRNGWTPLCAAAWRGHVRVVKRLISAGALLNPRQEFGATPLYVAVQNRRTATVAALLAAGADCDLPENRGWSPMHIAAQYGHVKVATLLINAGADISQQAEDGYTPLYIAAQNGYASFVRLLLSTEMCSVALLNLPMNDGSTSLWIAAQNGHVKVVDELIRAGADIELADCTDASPLWTAADHGHVSTVLRLLRAGATVDRCDNMGSSPLHAAVSNGHLKVTRLLLKYRAKVDVLSTIGNSPLTSASLEGHAECVRELLKFGANVNQSGFEGCSALYFASEGGHTRVVELLLKAGARTDDCNCFGCSPLWIASREGHLAVALQLLKAGANFNIVGEGHLTPLGIAVRSGNIGVIGALIEAGSDLNRVSASGTSSLVLAIDMRQEEAAINLLDAGVNVDVLDPVGMSPLWLAAQNGCIRVLNYLRSCRNPRRRTRQHWNRMLLDELKCFAFACYRGQIEVLASLSESQLLHSSDLNDLSGLTGSEVFVEEFKRFIAMKRSILPPVHRLESTVQHSLRLHQSLLLSGFSRENSVLQSGAAAVLQKIIRSKNQAGYFVVGSYADGWGNCLSRLDGRIEVGSDIDLTCIEAMPPFHLIGCTPIGMCSKTDCVPVQYSDGHIDYKVHVSSPSVPEAGTILKPAVDHVKAYPCCSYPPIWLLQTSHVSQIRPSVLQALRDEVQLAWCHVVAAAPPELTGDRMRVSTNLLERRLMQSLTSLQGQVFVVLKYLIKKVIGRRVKGLKSYHAKNLLFYMLDKTPEEEWQRPENLISLVEESLSILVRQLHEPSASSMECMRHFFLQDAAIYLHKGHDEKSTIAREVRLVIENLPSLLEEFELGLIPTELGSIEFHPFLFLPEVQMPKKQEIPAAGKIKFYQIDDLVYRALVQLFAEFDKRTQLAQLMSSIDRIPDSAKTTRECLKALASLKVGNRLDASQLTSTVSRKVAGHLKAESEEVSPASVEEAEQFVWKQMKRTDSAWKFSFSFKQTDVNPVFNFLPNHIREAFPSRLVNYDDCYYMNFDALMKAIQLEYSNRWNAADLFASAADGDSDPQELLMLLHYYRPGQDDQLLVQAVHRNRDLITESMLNSTVVNFIEARPQLHALSIRSAMDSLAKHLRDSPPMPSTIQGQEEFKQPCRSAKRKRSAKYYQELKHVKLTKRSK
ncbi:hypothetical protein BOX15_Mlig017752g1, partial [Macrostomum lignano]